MICTKPSGATNMYATVPNACLYTPAKPYLQFGGPHEHKGPDDFSGKRDDDEDEDDMTPAPEDIQAVQTQSAIPPHLQQPGFQHINHAPSASPPIPNGMPISRHGTPQQNLSRPSSRNHVRRVSNLGPQQHATPPPQNGFAYMSNPSMYNPNVHGPMNQPRPGQYPHQYAHPPGPQGTPPQLIHHPQGLPQQMAHQPQHFQHLQHQHGGGSQQLGIPQQPAPVQQVQQSYPSEQTRGPIPPVFAHDQQHHERPNPVENSGAMAGGLKQEPSESPPQPKMSKSHSIFTPIDDRGSVLARHFGGPAPTYESPRGPVRPDPPEDSPASRPSHIPAPTEPRTQSISSTPDLKPPQRTNSGVLNQKRPQLKVQIPSENSDRGSATAESSDRDSAGNKTSTPAKGSADNPPTGVVLPPPSPSAGAILSAGAQGPPNPFARPPPPGTTQAGAFGSSGVATSNVGNNNIDTPMSALPSRFVSDALLPSPSSFFPEWGFGRSGPDSNLLPSPLTFPTPAVQSGPSFSREDEQDKKRKSPDDGQGADAANKRPKP